MSAARPGRQPTFRLPVTPDDLVRHALAAYYRAVGDATAPMGDPDPVRWSNPQAFLDTMLEFMALRVRAAASVAGYEVEADHARFDRWAAQPMYRDMHISEVDPDYWTEIQAASAAASEPRDLPPAKPLFSGPAGQELPPPGDLNHAQTHTGGQIDG